MKHKSAIYSFIVSGAVVGFNAGADTYPSRAISFTVPYAAGGTLDGIARKLTALLSVELQQSIVVLNQPGAAGTLQLASLARAKPDGYTIGYYSYSTVTYTAQVMRVPFQRTDFQPLGGVAEINYGIVTHVDSPIHNLKDMVAQAATSKGVFYGVTGAPNNLPFLQLEKLTGGKFDQVTYKSSSESINAALGKQVDVSLHAPSEFAELVKAGKLRVIASASKQRLPWFPDIPTVKEQGHDIGIAGVVGVAAPKGIPDDVRRKLESSIAKVSASKEFKDFLSQEYGLSPFPASGAELSRFFDDGHQKMRDLIKKFDLKG